MLSLRRYHDVFSGCSEEEGLPLFALSRLPHCIGFLCCGAPGPGHVGFSGCGVLAQQWLPALEHRLRAQWLQCTELSCSVACGIF